jgi:hypothetical protein
MNSPPLTVLMSVYNGREYLERSIASILDQSFGDYEFLIINDGSTEPIRDVVNSFRDRRIRLVDQENVGLTRSLNRGLALAKGEYVARMDADDWSDPTRLAKQFSVISTNPAPALVGTHFEIVNDDDEIIEEKEIFTDDIYRLWRLQFHNNYGHGTVMFRKTSVQRAGNYDETLTCSQDYDLWSRLITKNNARIIPEFLYKYRLGVSDKQTSVGQYDLQLSCAIQISDRNLTSLKPDLNAGMCTQARSLYWRLEMDNVSGPGLELIPNIFDGFCLKYVLDGTERSKLVENIVLDVMSTVDNTNISENTASRVCRELRLSAECC